MVLKFSNFQKTIFKRYPTWDWFFYLSVFATLRGTSRGEKCTPTSRTQYPFLSKYSSGYDRFYWYLINFDRYRILFNWFWLLSNWPCLMTRLIFHQVSLCHNMMIIWITSFIDALLISKYFNVRKFRVQKISRISRMTPQFAKLNGREKIFWLIRENKFP